MANLLWWSLLASSVVHASPRIEKRQTISGNGTLPGTPPPTILAPVVPPIVDSNSLKVLTPSENITLYYQSSAPSKRKRGSAAANAQLAFRFKYPSVALDHSNAIGSVECTDTTVSANFDDADGFQHALSTWGKGQNSTTLYITSTVGCGTNDTQNGYFVANTTTFDQQSSTVLAHGSFVRANQTFHSLKMAYGQIPDSARNNLTKAKRDALDFTWNDEWNIDFDLSIEDAVGFSKGEDLQTAKTLAGQQDDSDAPWPNAFLVWKSGGDEDDKGKDGEGGEEGGESGGEEKRSLARRKSEVEKSLKAYCVDCDVNANLAVGGFVEYCIDPTGFFCEDDFGIEVAQAYITGTMHAGAYLGLVASISWEDKIKEPIATIPLSPLVIPEPPIVIGPFIELDLQFKLEVSAQATLLAGGALDWPNINGMIDFVNNENSYANGFEPDLTEKFEVGGEISVSAGVGLPVSIGLGVNVDEGFWDADVAIRDTFSINANASISVSYQQDNYFNATTGNITAISDNGFSVNNDDGCYGVDWFIYLENDLDLVANVGDTDPWTWPLATPWQHVLKQGCFGYLKPFCAEPVRASPLVSDDVQCNVPRESIIEGHELGDANHYENITICARECMKLQKCGGFSWDDDIVMCQLYDTGLANLTANWGTGLSMFDRNCWQTSDCPYSPDLSNATSSDPASQRRDVESQGLAEAHFRFLKFAG